MTRRRRLVNRVPPATHHQVTITTPKELDSDEIISSEFCSGRITPRRRDMQDIDDGMPCQPRRRRPRYFTAGRTPRLLLIDGEESAARRELLHEMLHIS